MLANSLKENKHMVVTLSTLNLSGNSFGPDSQGALSFLAEPNAVATLQLARCGIPFDLVSVYVHVNVCASGLGFVKKEVF